jgi:hypothetical protein
MPHTVDPRPVVSVLTGTWRIGASNIPVWMSGQRRSPTVGFEPVDGHPSRLTHSVSYTVANGHRDRHIRIATWHRGRFVSRGKRLRRVFPSTWVVSCTSEDDTICIIRFMKSRSMPAGITILVRVGHSHPDLRGMVGREHESFGLSPEEFARLRWFDLSSAPLR